MARKFKNQMKRKTFAIGKVMSVSLLMDELSKLRNVNLVCHALTQNQYRKIIFY
jgi:hypothetical protein